MVKNNNDNNETMAWGPRISMEKLPMAKSRNINTKIIKDGNKL